MVAPNSNNNNNSNNITSNSNNSGSNSSSNKKKKSARGNKQKKKGSGIYTEVGNEDFLSISGGVHQEETTMEEQKSKKQRNHIFRRRRPSSSKGMIAGFVSNNPEDTNDNSNNNSSSGNIMNDPSSNVNNNTSVSEDIEDDNNNNISSNSRNNNTSEGSVSSRLALFCVNNAINMGARTQLSLCPPGNNREILRKRLLERNNKQQQRNINPLFVPGGEAGIREYEAAEAAFLASAASSYHNDGMSLYHHNDGEDLDDHPNSSGDEDDLEFDALDDNNNTSLTDIININNNHNNLSKEPLYVPAAQIDCGASINNAAPVSGKLPFNYRKLKWFDQVSAADRAEARTHLRMELERVRKKNRAKLQLHLRQMQRQERNKMNKKISSDLLQLEKSNDNKLDTSNAEEDFGTVADDDSHAGFSILPEDMTPALSAALVLESLLIRPLESLDGMAKLYEGIVSAGTALLDADSHDVDKPTKSEICSALTACLLTTLEQSAGDTILALAKLRQNCGTPRYQRRFVHRIAPCLVRPPNAALWCLRHQKDMECIMAATEIILDAAPIIFAPGWWEKGRALRADSQRAETLKNAANQLKQLSSNNNHHHMDNNIDIFRLNGNTAASSSLRRRFSNSFKDTINNNTSASNKENLAEWEVLSVDRQIRTSINHLFTRDWSKDFTRDGDLASVASSHNRSVSRGISAGKLKAAEQTTANNNNNNINNNNIGNSFVNSSSSDILPSDISSTSMGVETSPLTPRFSVKHPATVPEEQQPETTAGMNINAGVIVTTNNKTMNYSFSSPPTTPKRRSLSPQREERRLKEHTEPPSIDISTPPQTPKSIPPTSVVRTPPRSPSSPPSQQQTTTNIMDSPSKHNNIPVPALTNSPSPFHDSLALVPMQHPTTPSSGSTGGPAPLSPSAQSSYNKKLSQRGSPHGNSSSVVSMGSSGSGSGAYTTGYLRSLTSTSDERKRTVAACRALRSQIARFEADFQKLHGRPPKGPLERAPLATTYAQYREWKKAIRADAACRIQALVRGASIRGKLSRDPDFQKIVTRKLGRRNIIIQLQIPHDIGGSSTGSKDKPYSSRHMRPMPNVNGSSPRSGSGEDNGGMGVEAVISPSNSGSIGSSSATRSRRGSGGRRPMPFDDGINYAGSGPLHRGSSNSSVTSVENSFADMSLGSQFDNMSITDLKRTKRQLKEDLKQYDKEFYAKHKRMPVKAEKEPIRHLYERYNGVKNRIAFMEKGVIFPNKIRSKGSSRLSDNRASGISSSNSDSSGGEDPPAFISPSSRSSSSSKKKEPKSIPAVPSSNTASSGNTLATELEHLKMEKNNLHQMLRNYEKDFFRKHNRQVSSYSDIQPVASQYRRYKDIKKSIAKLQSSDKR